MPALCARRGRTARSRRQRFATFALLTASASTCLVSIDSVLAVPRTWLNGAGGGYDTAANWSGGIVPAAADNTVFNLSGPYTVTFSTSRSIRDVSVAGDNVGWNLGGTTYSVSLAGNSAFTVGQAATDVAGLSVSNGSINATGGTIGGASGGRGSLTLANGFASFSSSLNVGSSGFGSVTLNTSGRIEANSLNLGVNSTGVGEVRVQGFGANLTVTGANACVIGAVGAGSFNVPGGSVNTNGVTLGNATTGSGTVNVSDGSSWANSGTVSVGNAGAGTLNVNAAVLSTHFLTLGDQTSGRGVARFTNNSIITCENNFVVGARGIGALTIDAASVMSSGNASIGSGIGGRGELNVSGGNTQLTVSGDLNVASDFGAVGTLNITNGATVTNSGNARIAVFDGSSAVVNISGPGSKWISNAPVQIAGSGFSLGSATVTIGAGASMIVSGANSLNLASTGALTLAGGTLSVGTLNNAGGLFNFNAGTLAFTGGSFAIANGAALGSVIELGANKTITVIGASQIATGGSLRLSGGNFSAGSLLNAGEILLDSPSSTLSASIINSGLIRGDGRISGALTNSISGEVRASPNQRIAFVNDLAGNANAGSLNLFGGAVEFDHLLTNSGRITGRGTLIAHGGVSNSGTISLSAGTTDAIGSLTNSAGGKTIVTGGSVSTFFDNVTNLPGSEFRVSTASTAVFLGDVVGLGAFTGPGTKDFEGNASGLMIDTGNGTTIVGPSAGLTADFVRDGVLRIEGRATITPNGSGASVSRVATLDNTGTLDLNDNDLIATSTPRSVIEAQIRFARHGGAWDRAGITSSSAQNRPQHNTTLGVLTGAEFHSIYGPANSFDGFPVADSDVLVKYTYYGDTDLNGQVNFDDYARTDGGFNNGRSGWLNGDFDLNGQVNFDDYSLIDLAFNTQGGLLMSPVPEPALSAVFGSLAIAATLPRRRSRGYQVS